MFLLDTNIISALRVQGRNPNAEDWARSVPLADLFICAPTVAELERGIVAKERVDPAQGSILRTWFEDRVLPAFAGRVLPFDLAAARVLGAFRVPEHAPLDDALIAAIAVSRQMTIVTRNTKHFASLDGVRVLNPWDRPL